MTPADASAAFARDWSGAGPLIMIVRPDAPSRAEALAAWSDSGATVLATAPPASAPFAWPYGDFGRPGRVRRREVFSRPDFVRFTFANGVVLNLMRTRYEQDQVKLGVVFGAGRRELADADRATAEIGAALFEQMGLGKANAAQIAAQFADTTWGDKLSIGDDHFALSGSSIGTRDELEQEFQLLTAEVSDPGFRDVDPQLATVVDTMYRFYRSRPGLVVGLAISEAVAPGNPEALPPKARMARLRTGDFTRVLKPALTQAPLEISIVGDVKEADAVDAVADTLERPCRPAPPPTDACQTPGSSDFPTILSRRLSPPTRDRRRRPLSGSSGRSSSPIPPGGVKSSPWDCSPT